MFDFSKKALGLVHTTARPNARRLSDIVTAGAIAPITRGVNYHAAADLIGDLGNDRYRCCVEAGVYRIAQLRVANALKSSWTPSVSAVLNLYSALTGFNPNAPASDNGTDVPTAMSRWATTGLNGLQVADEIQATVTIDPKDIASLQCAIQWFCAVGLSFALPKAAITASVWDVPTSGVDSPEGQPGGWGMHFAPSGRFDTHGNFYIITWGEEVPVTSAFIQAYAVAADTNISQTWLSASGQSPPSLNLTQPVVKLATLA